MTEQESTELILDLKEALRDTLKVVKSVYTLTKVYERVAGQSSFEELFDYELELCKEDVEE